MSFDRSSCHLQTWLYCIYYIARYDLSKHREECLLKVLANMKALTVNMQHADLEQETCMQEEHKENSQRHSIHFISNTLSSYV